MPRQASPNESPPPPRDGGVDRIRLLDLPRGRMVLTAYVGRFGHGGINPRTKKRDRTVLLRRIAYSGQVILDHQWFTAGRWSDHLSKLDIVTLRIKGVKQYERGYVRDGVRKVPRGTVPESHELNTPISATVVKPPGFIGLIVKRLDETMVDIDNFDIWSAAEVVRRGEIIMLSGFQREISIAMSQFVIDQQTREIVAGYITNRLHQYGSTRVNIQAIRRNAAKRKHYA